MSIKQAINDIFNQLSWLLANLSNEEYSHQSSVLNSASVGQHVRHTLEFFKCLVQGIDECTVNYDRRERDIFLENNTLQAQSLIDELKNSIEGLDESVELKLVQSYQESSQPIEVESNVLRELVYNLEHAVHHMALIRIGIKEVKPNLILDESFGVANSTMRYKKSQMVNS